MTDRTLKCFIPALALEHPSNGESFTLLDKIRYAVLRLDQNGNFDDLITVKDPVPYIFIKSHRFNKENMGYDVVAKIC